ncbi:MAG: activator of HSP90 ATPase [Flavobacteriaceae bacterium]|nr:MAG: activator of HSP90 ATPase [Flavobacteriaceae bacterium]
MSDLNSRTVTLKRTFNAPIKLVWEAWTQAEHIANWWGPQGMEVQIVEHDFNVGGQWKYTMLMPNGSEFITDGVYSEIVALKKIISSANFKPMTEGVEIQALFEEDGDKTNFTFNVVHPTEEYRIQQEKMGIMNGWGSVFDRLETLVSSLNK